MGEFQLVAFALVHALLIVVSFLVVRAGVAVHRASVPARLITRRVRIGHGLVYALAVVLPELLLLGFAVFLGREIWRAGR